jgi:hypothetical protein
MTEEEEWQRLTNVMLLEAECHVLAAEAAVEQHRCEDAEAALYVAQHPSSRLAELTEEARRYVRANRTVTEPYDEDFGWYCIELAVYGWRRDFGEWPSFFNLTDRVAVDRQLPHGVVGRRTREALNEPSSRVHLYMIRTAHLAEILAGYPTSLAPWNGEPEPDMRFYVSADGMTPLLRSHYRNRCWRMEAVA